MNIYEKYEKLGITDYKLRTIEDVKTLHGINILSTKGLEDLSNEDKELVIKLFIGYLNGFGCNNRKNVPTEVKKLNNKFKVTFEDGEYSYLYTDGSVG